MSSCQEKENSNIDVWSSIRNLKKKMRGSKTENEISALFQKSQNSTKFSSNTSLISHKELNSSQISQRDDKKKGVLSENINYESSNYCSRKSGTNDEFAEKSNDEEIDSHTDGSSFNRIQRDSYLTLKNVNYWKI